MATHKTETGVHLICHGRFRWTAQMDDTRLLYGSIFTMCKRTPQECLRDIADQLDRACVNNIFAPPESDGRDIDIDDGC